MAMAAAGSPTGRLYRDGAALPDQCASFALCTVWGRPIMKYFNDPDAHAMKTRGVAAMASLSGVLALSFATASQAAPATDAQHAAWRDAIARTKVPQEGCFTAAYPTLAWQQVACR